uniref:Glycosyltransferase n=1 Tax=Candidatus Kentrum sp. MB TaxID=2138164 RepID=A0A450X8I3_9GAMM|nr:MAG: hypothetical protein BECKMB1821G_GA0114241_101446 [Candidatus Kentron sp. MB]VFK34483.1 MAG: hypothetical protein BECKMB1821I_GA0114274_107310 [Candidatus Kentron sp. MB]VFK76779.1 MAG: hypothetical protein BECKMB1821H_GA0114242_107410 [Candidatus Kentron sp. MB]
MSKGPGLGLKLYRVVYANRSVVEAIFPITIFPIMVMITNTRYAPRHDPMTRKQNVRVLIFTKAPTSGKVKTRLIPALGAERAAALHEALIGHTLATTAQSGLALELWCYPDRRHPLFSQCANRFPVILHDQVGADLGARMYHAANMASTVTPMILIGADCPTLTAAELRETSIRLTMGNDAVLGPALDGGYYLLGINRIDRSLFEGIAWGSNSVLVETRRRLRALGWSWWEAAAKRDIDRPDDLAFLPKKLERVIG